MGSWQCPPSLRSGSKVERISPHLGRTSSWRSDKSSTARDCKPGLGGACVTGQNKPRSHACTETTSSGREPRAGRSSALPARRAHTGAASPGTPRAPHGFPRLGPTNASGFRRNTSCGSLQPADLPRRRGPLPRPLGASLLAALNANVHWLSRARLPPTALPTSVPLARLSQRVPEDACLLNRRALCQERPPPPPHRKFQTILCHLKSHLSSLRRWPRYPPPQQSTYHVPAVSSAICPPD